MTIIRRVLEERWLFFIGLFGLAVGLPLSRSFVSIAPVVIFAAWLIDGFYRNDFADKWRRFRTNRICLALSSLFIVYLLWALCSDNYGQAVKLILDKLPLIILPLALSGLEFPSQRSVDKIFSLHVAAVFVSTLLSFLNWKFNSLDGEIRDSVMFVNHIRLSLMIVLTQLVLYYRFRWELNWTSISQVILTIWFMFFIYQFQLVTGFALLMLVLIISALKGLTKRGVHKVLGLVSLAAIASLTFFSYPTIKKQFDKPPVSKDLQKARTAEGRSYTSLQTNLLLENGHYVWHYVQMDELRREWNDRAKQRIGDKEGEESLFVGRIIRYMTSKGLRKDAEGINALSDQDIVNIEMGLASIGDIETSGMRKRLETLCVEMDSYYYGGNPSLSSLTVKFEYWRTGWTIFKRNMWTGVGVGDVRDEFNSEYQRGTMLAEHSWDKAHNQYLTWAITFGSIGALIALIAFLAPLFSLSGSNNYIIALFYIVFLVSFLMEDTLETQLGLNLYLFYIGILVIPSSYLLRTSR